MVECNAPRALGGGGTVATFHVANGSYYEAQYDYTHFDYFGIKISQLHRTSATQGFLAGILLCN